MTQIKAEKPSTLRGFVERPMARQRLIDDAVVLVDQEAHARGGLSGLAIKGAYMVIKKIKPTIIAETIDHLLDGFIEQLEPFYAEFTSQTVYAQFSDLLIREKSAVANGLLKHTDDKAKVAQNPTLKKAYEKLRPMAQEQVQMSVPNLARMIDKHVV